MERRGKEGQGVAPHLRYEISRLVFQRAMVASGVSPHLRYEIPRLDFRLATRAGAVSPHPHGEIAVGFSAGNNGRCCRG